MRATVFARNEKERAGTTMKDTQASNGARLQSLGGAKMSRRQMLKHAGAAGALSTVGRSALVAGGAAVGSTLSAPAVSRAQEGITLRGIFLPATWGTITQEVFAKEYEKQTGVKVEIELIGRDAIHDKMGTLLRGYPSCRE